MNRYGLPREKRVRKQSQFNAIFRKCRKFESRSVIVYCQNPTPYSGTVGVIAGKRVGNAVKRNRCKRLLKEIYRLNQYQIDAQCSILLVAKPKLLAQSFQQMQEEMKQVFVKAGIWRSK